MLCRAVRQDTLDAFSGKAAYLAFPWSPLPTWGGGAGQSLPTGSATENSGGYPAPRKNKARAHPQPPWPGALPGGADEFTVMGAEAEAGGGAAAMGALVSGGNIRSCFLTFNFLR